MTQAELEKRREAARKWRRNNLELARKRTREANAKWRKANPEECRARQKAYRNRNLERSRERGRKWMAEWRKEHRKEDRLRSFNYRLRNPDMGRKWHREHRERGKVSKLKVHYKLTLEEYRKMLLTQGSCCAICGDAFIGTPHVDHCHTTKKIRGLLCKGCNWGLGHYKDSPERLRAAAAYLEKAR